LPEEPWLLYMLAGVRETASWTTDKIHAIRDLIAHTAEYVRARAPKYYSRELVELIFTQPYCRIANVVESGIAQRQTASVYLKVLTEIGVVSELKVGREKLFIHPKFIGLLTSEEHSFDAYATKKRSRVR